MYRVLRIGFLSILALLPFHALVYVWLTSNFGHIKLWQTWKEILLVALLPLVIWLLLKQPAITRRLFARRVNQLILAYLALHLSLWAVYKPEFEAAVAGLLINLRFLALFALGQLLILVVGSSELVGGGKASRVNVFRESAIKFVLVGGAFVSLFGLLQFLVLPADFLSHFGYGPDTIVPFQRIDFNDDFVRVSSTLRGANPLGLYLILIVPLLLAVTFNKFSFLNSRFSLKKEKILKLINVKRKMINEKWLFSLVLLASLITLYASQSRSGWLGTATALSLLAQIKLPFAWRRQFLAFGVFFLLAASALLLFTWNTDFIQNTVLHEDPGRGPALNSTEAHFAANQTAAKDVLDHPLGQGPGTAGPASFYTQPAKISENYYLQVAQEVGLIGLGLFIAIAYLVAKSLYTQRQELLPAVLFSSFIGLSLSALFLHTWAQDEIALIFWGLAGLFYKE